MISEWPYISNIRLKVTSSEVLEPFESVTSKMPAALSALVLLEVTLEAINTLPL